MRWYPGYTVAAVSTVALVLTAPGQTILVSLLNVPLRNTFDIDPLWLNASYTVATVAASLPLVWMGRLLDRFGPKRMLIAVAVAFGCGCLVMASVAHFAMVVLAFFLLRFLGQGSLSMVSSHALAMWFHRRLGTLAGFRSVALFAAWAPMPALTLALFDAVGWRMTWAIYGIVIAVVVSVLSWLFVTDRPEQLGLRMDDAEIDIVEEPGFTLSEAIRTRAYWILALPTGLSAMIITAVLFDVQPMLAARGLDADTAGLAVSAWSATMALLALPSGWLVDRLRPSWILAAGLAALIGSCALLVAAHSSTDAIAALSIMALGNSLISAAIGATAARYFGRQHHGAIRSSLTRIGVISTGIGPLLFGLSQSTTGAFDAALWIFVALSAPPMLGSLLLSPPALPSRP